MSKIKTNLKIILLALITVCLFNCKKNISLSYHLKGAISPAGDTLLYYIGCPPKKDISSKALVMIQGSGKQSIKKRFGTGAEVVQFGYDIILMEKFAFNDSIKFNRTNSLERRTQDISFLLNHLEKNIYKGKLKSITLLADSEGGVIAPEVALNNSLVHRILIMGSGGMSQADEFYSLIKSDSSVAKPSVLKIAGITTKVELDSIFEDIKTSPDSLKIWLGHPYKRWKSFLWYSPMPAFEKLNIPIMVISGMEDRSMPIESVIYLKEKMINNKNFTFHLVPEADHQFMDFKGKPLLPGILKNNILPWFKETEKNI